MTTHDAQMERYIVGRAPVSDESVADHEENEEPLLAQIAVLVSEIQQAKANVLLTEKSVAALQASLAVRSTDSSTFTST